MTGAEGVLPSSIDELLERIQDARTELDGVVAPLSPSRMEEPLGGGWSVKLHLAHISDWETGIVAVLRRESRVEAMGLTQALSDVDDTDAMNALMAERAEAEPLADVLYRYGKVHQDLVERIRSMPDADLQLPYSHFQPSQSSPNSTTILQEIAWDTFTHYPDHARWIGEALASG